MAEFNTFLKLHRSILDSAVFSDAETLRVWIYILCKAAIQDRQILVEGKVVNLKKGQLITGRKKIAEQLKMTEAKARRALKLLEELGNVTIKSTNKFSIVTVANWAKFQEGSANLANRTPANRQQNTSKPPTKRQQPATNKELKEIKEFNNLRMNEDFSQPTEEQKIKSLYGELGKGVVMLSDEQMGSLLDMLSAEEFDKYVGIVRDCELSGKSFKRKTHYQAILDMVKKDRKV